MKVALLKKAANAKAPVKMKAGAAPPVAFVMLDNQNDSCTVLGTDAAGNTLDISAVATITVSSDNTALLTVSAPSGTTFTMTAVGPVGTANVAVVATWNDPAAGIGPFSFTLPVVLAAGGATGVVIQPGTPVVNP